MADLIHTRTCDPGRTEVTHVDHRGGRAEVRRCLDCSADAVTWLVEPRRELPDGFEPLHVPNPQHGVRIT